jgi:predicted nuclease of restriction endonuclease-like (RecB) superfamily
VLINDPEYLEVVEQVKARIELARRRAAQAVTSEGIILYWDLGRIINEHSVWGNKFVPNLARDIQLAYPGVKGYSVRSLRYMAKLASAYPSLEIVQRSAALLPWRHNQVLLDKVEDLDERVWYATETLSSGWSRDVLALQIDTGLYGRQVTAEKTSNYETRLPPPQSDLAVQALKEPYVFDIVVDRDARQERAVEQAMVANVTKLLLELGTGFAFVGQQYHLEVEGEDFYIDLLFYHLKLRCYVVVELKAGRFKPEFAGKLNFYVSAVDALLKAESDQPTIGILLCRDKRGLVAEFALKDIEKPIGVSEYKLLSEWPDQYADLLPSAEDITSRLGIAVGDEGQAAETDEEH